MEILQYIFLETVLIYEWLQDITEQTKHSYVRATIMKFYLAIMKKFHYKKETL